MRMTTRNFDRELPLMIARPIGATCGIILRREPCAARNENVHSRVARK